MNAHIYLRVSTPRQLNGHSIGTEDEHGVHDAKARACCHYKEWPVAGVYTDAGKSGRTLKRRDGLAAAVKAACADGGVVVVYAVARLGRSTRDLYNLVHKLEESGAHFASATEDINTATAMGKAFFGLLAVFAQLESDQISERVKASNSHIVKKLGYRKNGQQPYGYTIAKDGPEKGTRVEHHGEQLVLSAARSLRMGRSCAEVADELNRRGYRTRPRAGDGGQLWTEKAVRRILTAPHLYRLIAEDDENKKEPAVG